MRTISVPLAGAGRLMGESILLALVYYAFARLGLTVAFAGTNATPVWPAAGIALAALMLRGRRLWGGIWFGAFAVNVVTFFQHHPPGIALGVSAVVASGNTLGALAGWKVCDKWAGNAGSAVPATDWAHPFGRMSVFQFLVASMTAGLVSAIVGPAVICAAHIGTWDDYQLIALTWGCGDTTGILYVTPFVLSWSGVFGRGRGGRGSVRAEGLPAVKGGTWKRMVDPAVAMVALVVTCWAVFATDYLMDFPALALKSLPLAILTWVAVRMGVRGATLGLIIVAISVGYSGRRYFGALETVEDLKNVLGWLGYLWVIGLMFMALAAAADAHRRVLSSLREAKSALEATMDAIPALVCVAHDPQCERITANAPAYELLGIPAGDNIASTVNANGGSAFEVHVGGKKPPVGELAMHKAAATGLPVLGQEQELIFPDGHVRFIYGNAMPLLDEHGASRGSVAAFVDVTDRHRAVKALEESEERFRAMADVAPVMIWMSGVDRLCHYFNRPWLEFTGRTLDQELGRGWTEGVHPDDLEKYIELYISSSNARLEFRMEYRLRRNDGEYRWLLDHGVPRFGTSGEFVGYIGSCMDITERKQVESDTAFLLGISEQRRNASDTDELLDAAVATLGPHVSAGHCWFATLDADGENFTIHRDWRAEGEGHEGTYSMSSFGPDVVIALRAGHFVAITEVGRDVRTAVCAESYRRLGMGACAIAPILREARVVAMLAIATAVPRTWSQREVSLLHTVAERTWLAMERLRLAEELGAGEARFRTMAEWVPVFIFTTEPDGGVDYINARFTAYTGISPQAAAGVGWMQALHPDDRAGIMEQWGASISTGQPFSSGLRMCSSEGDYRWFHCHAHPVYDEHFRIVKWFGTCADIDELMHSQRELRALNERLEERVEERTEQLMTANRELEKEFNERQRLEQEMLDVSERERRVLGQDLHDGLCQHLSGLAFMAETLSYTLRDKGMEEESNRLNGLIELIRSAATQARDVARGLHPVDVDANGLVAALRDLAQRHSTSDHVRCRFRCGKPVPLQDNNVALHLYRIAQEAVVNAQKHAGASEIVIDLSVGGSEINLSVMDDGRGFQQDAPSPNSGMGLHLMRYRAGVIGGNFRVESYAGRGTVVTCVLPVKEADKKTATGPVPLVVRKQDDVAPQNNGKPKSTVRVVRKRQ